MERKNVMAKGNRFGKLIAVKYVNKDKYGKSNWEFKCGCGGLIVCLAVKVKRGDIKSCGCLRGGTSINQPLNLTKLTYNSWRKMKERCYDKNRNNYWRYGGRGITVCAEWCHSFHAFLADMGPRPSKDHSIDRINVDGHYCKENCAWSTSKEQQANRSNNVKLWFRGKLELQAYIVETIGMGQYNFMLWTARKLNPDEIEVYVNYRKQLVKRWNTSTIITYISDDSNLYLDFTAIFHHQDYVVVSRTVECNNKTVYKIVVRGKKEEYDRYGVVS